VYELIDSQSLCSIERRYTIRCDILIRSGDICDRSLKSSEIAPNFARYNTNKLRYVLFNPRASTEFTASAQIIDRLYQNQNRIHLDRLCFDRVYLHPRKTARIVFIAVNDVSSVRSRTSSVNVRLFFFRFINFTYLRMSATPTCATGHYN